MAEKKAWGRREFWGVGYEFDPRWFLTDSQKQLQARLIELCRTTLRPNAIISDETYEFPRKNIDAMAELGLLSLIVPQELGGMGENQQCATMVCETIARYGCPSTGLVYVMHLMASSVLLMRHHNNETIKTLLRRLTKDKLLGTIGLSDAATGGHFWYQISGKCWELPDGSYKLLKHTAWTTSAGFADWYVIQVPSPGFAGNYMNNTNFLIYNKDVRANTEDWSAMGMHGNQSGPCVFEAILPRGQRIGPEGDGTFAMIEVGIHFFCPGTAAVYNGIAMGSIDLAKRHVVSKTHGDSGLRVCDYGTIQDKFGCSLNETNASRTMLASLCYAYDQLTDNNDWSFYSDVNASRRKPLYQWSLQIKAVSSTSVTHVVDAMMQACGGTGYKKELGLERLVRDAKAGWLMGPTNELINGVIGKWALMGADSVDLWYQVRDERILRTELRKLNNEEKLELAERLAYEATQKQGEAKDKYDFDNPLSDKAPCTVGETVVEGVKHSPALLPDKIAELKLSRIEKITKNEKYAAFTFEFPDVNMHLGCMPGQYVEMLIPGSATARKISPTSDPSCYGKMQIVVKYENRGVMAKYMEELKVSDTVSFRGPCGGFEYVANTYNHIVLLCGGVGVTPAIQLVRYIHNNPVDTTQVTMLFQAKNLDELLFRDELDDYARNDKLKVVYTLQSMDDAWTGSDGFIDYNFLKQQMPAAGIDGRLKIVVCGGGQLITSALNALMLLKFRSEDIFIYGSFAADQLRNVFGNNALLFNL